MTIRSVLHVTTMAASIAAVVVMTAGCSVKATTPRPAASERPAAPQRALRIYPVGALIAVEQTIARQHSPVVAHGFSRAMTRR